jgi:hypothetical protein
MPKTANNSERLARRPEPFRSGLPTVRVYCRPGPWQATSLAASLCARILLAFRHPDIVPPIAPCGPRFAPNGQVVSTLPDGAHARRRRAVAQRGLSHAKCRGQAAAVFKVLSGDFLRAGR